MARPAQQPPCPGRGGAVGVVVGDDGAAGSHSGGPQRGLHHVVGAVDVDGAVDAVGVPGVTVEGGDVIDAGATCVYTKLLFPKIPLNHCNTPWDLVWGRFHYLENFPKPDRIKPWRVRLVAYGACLESRFPRKWIQGSNP